MKCAFWPSMSCSTTGSSLEGLTSSCQSLNNSLMARTHISWRRLACRVYGPLVHIRDVLHANIEKSLSLPALQSDTVATSKPPLALCPSSTTCQRTQLEKCRLEPLQRIGHGVAQRREDHSSTFHLSAHR